MSEPLLLSLMKYGKYRCKTYMVSIHVRLTW